MQQLDEHVSMAKAAAVMGVPSATIRGWRHSGRIPAPKRYTVADFLSMVTAQRLTLLGMAIEPAASIGWAIRDEWQHITKRSSPVYLFVTRADEAVPFEWAILTPEQLASRHNAGALHVNLLSIVLEVQYKLSVGHG